MFLTIWKIFDSSKISKTEAKIEIQIRENKMLDKGLNNVVEKKQLSKFKIEGKIVHQIFFKEKNLGKKSYNCH